MRSKSDPDPIDFSSVPTSPRDVQKLLEVRQFDRMNPEQYLEFLLAFIERHPPSREIPSRHEPFVL